MECVLISGGTGLIGRALSKKLLNAGYEVIILTRDKSKHISSESRLSYSTWDIKKQTISIEAIRKADHIIHLAGAGVADKRWTPKRKLEILESRTLSSAILVRALNENPNKVRTLVSASAIGWYGNDSQKPQSGGFIESDPPAPDFLGTTCRKWEESISPASKSGIRVVILRTGIVLSNEGGALKEFRKPLKFGIAPILGRGSQILSWIAINDLVRMYIYVLENPGLAGVYNAAAPNPVTNKEFIVSVAESRKNLFYIPVHIPAALLKIVLGEMAIEVLKSTTVNSDKIQRAGFKFLFPTLKTALKEIS